MGDVPEEKTEHGDDELESQLRSAAAGSTAEQGAGGWDPFSETMSDPDSAAMGQHESDAVDGSAMGRIPATRTLGRYALHERLGQGAFGAVYRARDTVLDRNVAIKVPRQMGSAEQTEGFMNEARRLAKLQHPSIVSIHDVGSHEGICYIVTDLLQGQSLTSLLHERSPSWREAVRLVSIIGEALGHAHARSMIHRDVKPANIFITDGGLPILLDFGLALSDLEEEELGIQSGTPSYMAPEQVRGQAHRVDGRTDIYSLGVVLYELLCGRRPFRSTNLRELFRRIRDDDPQPLRQLVPELSPELEQVCLRAMARQMSDRFTTAGDFATALQGVLDVEPHTHAVVDAPAQPPSDAEPSGASSTMRRRMAAHKRHVTVVVFNCELTDVNNESSIPDAEYQHELVQSLVHCCTHSVEEFGGTIIPSTGQDVAACFGFPVICENAAERAIRAALDVMHEALSSSSGLSGRVHEDEKLSVWAAIHSGAAVVEDGAHVGDDFVLVGEARTVASRMEPLTDSGTITISDETERLVKGLFDTEDIGKRQLRGVAQPMSFYVVHRATASHRRLDRISTGGLSPLVGRDTELAVLRERWDYVAQGQGQVILLIGEAGLGKSRLVHELKRHIAGQDEGQVLEWNCSPYRVNSSLHPAIECLSRLLEFASDTPAPERLTRLKEHLQPLGIGNDEQVSLFASLLSIPAEGRYAPLGLSPQRTKERTQELLLDWLRELSLVEPMLFIVEDLHWVDASTIAFLEAIVDAGVGERILTLLTFRPEFELLWSSRAHQTQVALNRLTQRQVCEMITARSCGADPSAGLVERIAQRTDGVPLFVEEFAKIANDSVGNPDEIPVTLQDLLLARLDRMQSDMRVIQISAALGREFSYDQLYAVADMDEPVLREELSKLVAAEIVFQKGRFPSCRFTFKHALLQDAAYQSLLRTPRQRYHQKIAEVLESRFADVGDSQPELLAHHFAEAGSSARAVAYWLAAGQRSQACFANLEAINYFRNGLALIDSLEPSIKRDQMELELQLGLSTVMTMAKGWAYPDVESVHLRARELCRGIGDGSPLFHVTWGMWAWRLLRDELDTAHELAEEIWHLAEKKHDDGYLMEACFSKECTALFRGEFEDCLTYGRRGAELYDPDRCRFHAALTGMNAGCTVHSFWSWGAWIAGYPEQALRIGQQGVDLGEHLNDPFSHAHAIYHLGCVQQHCRMGAAAVASGERALQIGQEQGFDIWIALGMLCKGSGLLLEGECLDEGAALIQQGVNGFRGSGAELSLTHSLL